jgi:hypothetical protein
MKRCNRRMLCEPLELAADLLAIVDGGNPSAIIAATAARGTAGAEAGAAGAAGSSAAGSAAGGAARAAPVMNPVTGQMSSGAAANGGKFDWAGSVKGAVAPTALMSPLFLAPMVMGGHGGGGGGASAANFGKYT